MKTLVYTKGKENPSAISFFNNKGFLATIPKNTFMSTHVIGWNNQHRWRNMHINYFDVRVSNLEWTVNSNKMCKMLTEKSLIKKSQLDLDKLAGH